MLEHAKVISWKSSADQNILSKKSEALDSQPMLEHAMVIWLIRISFLRNQRHCTYFLCCSMQRSFVRSEHFSWEIKGTVLTLYIGKCKIIWLIRTCFLKNQRHCTNTLCWNMQRSFDWSEHSFWEIRGTALTSYVGICKSYSTDQNIFLEKSEALY